MDRQVVVYLGRAALGLSLLATACLPLQPPTQRVGVTSTNNDDVAPTAADTAQAQANPAASDARAAKRGGALSIALQRDLSVTNPLAETKSTDRTVRELMYEPLLALDDAGNIRPRLAERWEVSADGKLYTFHLRKGVKFHSGQEMTAEDARFALEHTLDPRNGAYGYSRLGFIERVQAPDRYTLNVHLKTPSPIFLSMLTNIQSFSVVPNGSVETGVDRPSSLPPGTGPFKFVEWQPKQRIVFERNPDYWGQEAYLDRVVFRPIDEATVRMTALRAGDVDVADFAPYEWVREIQQGRLKGFGLTEASTAGFLSLVFNAADPPFDNRALRQAVAHAVDKKEILQAAYLGFGEPGDQKYPRGHPWYIEGVPSPAYDLDRARALLREAGYSGETIPIILSQAQDRAAAGTALQAQLRKIGMNVSLEVLETGAYREAQRRGTFAFFFSGGQFDTDPWLTYEGNLACEPDLRRRTGNSSGYCDREIESLLQRAEAEPDQAKRRDLFRQILTKFWHDAPEVYIGYIPWYFAFRDPVKGFTVGADGQARLMHHGGGLSSTWLDR
jgi:peptide/nickel transport system substrate-binding protein